MPRDKGPVITTHEYKKRQQETLDSMMKKDLLKTKKKLKKARVETHKRFKEGILTSEVKRKLRKEGA
ncbi:MAG: hypothetical protein ACWGQW_09015 [bacterium]